MRILSIRQRRQEQLNARQLQSNSDESDDAIPIAPAKPKLNLLRIVLLTSALCLAVLSLVIVQWKLSARNRLHNLLTELSAAGHPISAVELQKTYPKSTGQEAAERWLKPGNAIAAANLSTQAFNVHEELPLPGESWPEARKALAYVDSLRHELDDLHDAASTDELPRFDVEVGVPQVGALEDILPYWNSHKHVPSFLKLAAFVHAKNDQSDNAFACINTALRLSLSLRDEPFQWSQSLANQSVQIATACLDDLIDLDPSDKALVELQNTIRQFNLRASIRRSLQGTLVNHIEFYESPKGFDTNVLFRRSDDLSFHIEQLQSLLNLNPQEHDWMDFINAAALAADEAAIISENFLLRMRYPYSHQTGDYYLGLVKYCAATDARLRMADTSLAIKRFQMQQGRSPESLVELVPEFLPQLPIDPFQPDGAPSSPAAGGRGDTAASPSVGQPLQFKKTDGVITIYSIGENRVDDGGSRAHDERETPQDITMTLLAL